MNTNSTSVLVYVNGFIYNICCQYFITNLHIAMSLYKTVKCCKLINKKSLIGKCLIPHLFSWQLKCIQTIWMMTYSLFIEAGLLTVVLLSFHTRKSHKDALKKALINFMFAGECYENYNSPHARVNIWFLSRVYFKIMSIL